MLPATRWPCLLQDVLNRRLLFKTTGSSSTKVNASPTVSFLELGRRKLSMQPKFVAAQKMLKETETQQTSKWIAWDEHLGIIPASVFTHTLAIPTDAAPIHHH